MNQTLTRWTSQLTTRQLALLTVLALGLHVWAGAVLDAAYAASAFPVPYYEAQLSFDHEKLKGWYAFLQANGSFDRYLHAQSVDFLFIASVLLLHPAALLLIARLLPTPSTAHRLMVAAAVLSVAAPLADALENAVTYVMLADPAGFAPGLAWAYSSLAAIKFAMFTFAYGAGVMGLLAALVSRRSR